MRLSTSLCSTVLVVAATVVATAAQASRPPMPVSAPQEHNSLAPVRAPSATPYRMHQMTVGELMSLCNADPDPCTIYIQGVVDGQAAMIENTTRDVPYCLAESTTPDQVRNAVLEQMARRETPPNWPAATVVAKTLAEKWPQCKASEWWIRP